MLRYTVTLDDPASHEIAVTMDVPAIAARPSLRVGLPAWAPGSYMVRDFARHLYDLSITDDRGRPVSFRRLDKQRWEIASEGRAVRIRYRVFAFEETVRTSFFDDQHAYWNGTSLFLYVEEEWQRPCLVEVKPPSGWQVSTALPKRPGRAQVFRSRSYDELADSPFEVGTHELFKFRVGSTRFEVALYGRTNADVPRLLRDLRRIVAATGAIFGGFPFRQYLFIIHCLGSRGGGLEHAASTTLDVAGLGFEDEKAYQRFNELAAHEFFHVWNVKRIRDQALNPFDYRGENYTRLLWFHEGFTEYMESIILLRAGLLDPGTYVADLADGWTRYIARPGRNVTPLSELSFEAWIKLYKPADNHTNRTVSYYEKGMWAALCLEILMREATGGRRGILQLFQRLWRDFGAPDRGLTAADIEAAVAALTGRPLRGFFRRYIDGTDELPVPALLRRAGIEVLSSLPSAEDHDDPIKRRRKRAFTGITFVAPAANGGSDRAVIRTVVPDSPAWAAGLTFGDEVVAVERQRVTGGTAARRLADYAPGDRVRVDYFRRDTLRSTTLGLVENVERRLSFALAGPLARPVRGIRRGWLGR